MDASISSCLWEETTLIGSLSNALRCVCKHTWTCKHMHLSEYVNCTHASTRKVPRPDWVVPHDFPCKQVALHRSGEVGRDVIDGRYQSLAQVWMGNSTMDTEYLQRKDNQNILHTRTHIHTHMSHIDTHIHTHVSC